MLARVLLALCALTVVDCAQQKFVLYKPLEEKTAIEEKKLYAATEGALLDRGYLFQKRDEATHRLLTKPRTLGAETETKFKYVWAVDTAGGTLKIQLMCQETSPLSEPVACAKETPEKVVKEQRAIADQALREARGD